MNNYPTKEDLENAVKKEIQKYYIDQNLPKSTETTYSITRGTRNVIKNIIGPYVDNQYVNNLIKFIGLYPEGQFPTTADLDTISQLVGGKKESNDGLRSSILNSIKNLGTNGNYKEIDNPQILKNFMNEFCIDLLNDKIAKNQYNIDMLSNTLNAILKPDDLKVEYTYGNEVVSLNPQRNLEEMKEMQELYMAGMKTISDSLNSNKDINYFQTIAELTNNKLYSNTPIYYTHMFKNYDRDKSYAMPKEMSEAIKQAKKDTHPYINSLETLREDIRESDSTFMYNKKINALIEADKKAYLLCVNKIEELCKKDAKLGETYAQIFNQVKSSQRITSAELSKNISIYIPVDATHKNATIEKKMTEEIKKYEEKHKKIMGDLAYVELKEVNVNERQEKIDTLGADIDKLRGTIRSETGLVLKNQKKNTTLEENRTIIEKSIELEDLKESIKLERHSSTDLNHIKTSIKKFENRNEYSELNNIVHAAQEELDKLNNPTFGKKIYNLFTQGNKQRRDNLEAEIKNCKGEINKLNETTSELVSDNAPNYYTKELNELEENQKVEENKGKLNLAKKMRIRLVKIMNKGKDFDTTTSKSNAAKRFNKATENLLSK